MTKRRALCLGLMACEFVAEAEAPDISDWMQAVSVLRDLLHETRQPVQRWFYAAGPGAGPVTYTKDAD